MFWTLSDFSMNIDVVEPSSSYSDDQNLVFTSPDEAARLLERYTNCWQNYSAIQEAIVSIGETPQGLSPQELAAQLARLIVSGRLKIRRSLPLNDRFFRGTGGLKLGVWTSRSSTTSAQNQAPADSTAPANDWIKVRVVDDASGMVIAKVVLDLKTPDGNTEQHTTRLSGEIESLGLQSGNCEVSCNFKGATLENTLAFVGVGNSPISQQDRSDSPSDPLPRPQSASQLFIAAIEEHKVSTGETLESLAKSVGMTRDQLARFNWGTDAPEEVNNHLAGDVGCTKKGADGTSYQFDDSDNPGIVYLPRPWTQSGLSTNQFHVIRVSYLSYTPQDTPKTVNLLEFEDAFFRTKSAVLLPEHQEAPTEGTEADTPSTTGLVASCLQYCADHPEVKALVTGHADTTGSDAYNIPLSKYRAQSVYAAIAGERDKFMEACDGPHLTSKQEKLDVTHKDRIQILDWVSLTFGWPCGFTQNNNDYFRAVSAFQRSYNENSRAGNENGEDLAVDGDWGKKTWGGVFDCYEANLASSLGVRRAGLADQRTKVQFVDANTPYTGCGEYHPIDNLGRDNYRSQKNRRVEVVFFDPGDEPALECFQGGCAEQACPLYDPATYDRKHLPPGGNVVLEDWTAVWSKNTAQEGTPVQMVLTAPGLAAGTRVTFEVIQEGYGPVGQVTAEAEDSKASAEFRDWYKAEAVPDPVTLDDGQQFQRVTFTFKASVEGKVAGAREPLTYADRLYVRVVDDAGNSIASTKVLIDSPWGTLRSSTNEDGVVDVEGLPPGGVHIHLPQSDNEEVVLFEGDEDTT